MQVGLPTDGRTLYVTLSWVIDGVVYARSEYVYTASNSGVVNTSACRTSYYSTYSRAQCLPGSMETFAWNSNGLAVDEWRLWVGKHTGEERCA